MTITVVPEGQQQAEQGQAQQAAQNQTQQAPAQQTQATSPQQAQVQQPVQTPVQQAPITSNDFIIPQPARTQAQPQSYVLPENVATRDDLNVIASIVQKNALDMAITKFQNENKDHALVSAEMLDILEKNPGLWDLGPDKALNYSYSQAMLAKMKSGQASVAQQTSDLTQQINQTAENIQNLSNQSTNTNPLNHNTTDNPDDYINQLVAMAKGNSLF